MPADTRSLALPMEGGDADSDKLAPTPSSTGGATWMMPVTSAMLVRRGFVIAGRSLLASAGIVARV